MSDRIEIVKRNNKRYSIPFSDINSIRILYSETKETNKFLSTKSSKILYKEVNQNDIMQDYHKFSEWKSSLIGMSMFLSIPYQIGVPLRVEDRGIFITRKSGVGLLKLLLPWLQTLEKSRSYFLFPSEPKEFSEQLYVAYEKWKRLNIKAH
jgi:hypothetical protein